MIQMGWFNLYLDPFCKETKNLNRKMVYCLYCIQVSLRGLGEGHLTFSE